MRLRTTPLLIHAAILASLLALPASAQNQPAPAHDPDALDTTTTDTNSPPPPITPEQVALIERYLTPVHAQPVSKIDTRTAAAGQGITLQVTQDATLANGAQLPKGTRLAGRILRAQPYQKDSAAALLSIRIDHAVLKDGSTIPIRCVLRALVPAVGPNANLADASQPGSRPRRSSSSSVGGPTTGSIPLGDPTPMGGSIGADPGGIGADSSGYPGTTGNPDSTSTRPVTTTTAGVPTGDPGIGGSPGRIPLPNTAAVAATAVPELPVAAAGESIHDTPHPTGLPGVLLSGASITGTSGTLSAYQRDITLDPATQLTLGVISAK